MLGSYAAAASHLAVGPTEGDTDVVDEALDEGELLGAGVWVTDWQLIKANGVSTITMRAIRVV